VLGARHGSVEDPATTGADRGERRRSDMKRIQRQRTKGWRMPEGAVYVGRPSLFGNPWSIRDGQALSILPRRERAAWCVRRYRDEMASLGLLSDYAYVVSDAAWERVAALGFGTMAEYARHLLRGHDLVCWCPLDQPCHADVLLELIR
jgi:hypothetical protein